MPQINPVWLVSSGLVIRITWSGCSDWIFYEVGEGESSLWGPSNIASVLSLPREEAKDSRCLEGKTFAHILYRLYKSCFLLHACWAVAALWLNLPQRDCLEKLVRFFCLKQWVLSVLWIFWHFIYFINFCLSPFFLNLSQSFRRTEWKPISTFRNWLENWKWNCLENCQVSVLLFQGWCFIVISPNWSWVCFNINAALRHMTAAGKTWESL